MSAQNVLPPSAPPEHIYPDLPSDFRMKKINEISAALHDEVGLYRTVAKKYKRTKMFVNWGAGCSSALSFVFSSASFGSAISVIGLPATIPLGGVAGGFALVSSGLIVASKKLDSKIKKHQEIVTLAIAKRDTVDRLLSKAMRDNRVSDDEFQLIMDEHSQYNVLKGAVRAKLTRKPSSPNLDKIKKKIREEVELENRKKMQAAVAALN